MVRAPRHARQPNQNMLASQNPALGDAIDEITPNNSLEVPPCDSGLAAMMSAMQAISAQMVALSSRVDKTKQRYRSSSAHRSATSTQRGRDSRTPKPSPPPRVPPALLNAEERYAKLTKVQAGLNQDLAEPRYKTRSRSS
ncbi:unnamed protein product [Gordionus sp. m RMFG-2023]